MLQRGYFLLRYKYPVDVLARRAPLRDEHLALAKEETAAGRLLLGGALVPPEKGGFLAFFATRKDVEAFVQRDPYVQKGLVEEVQIDEWNVVVGAAMVAKY